MTLREQLGDVAKLDAGLAIAMARAVGVRGAVNSLRASRRASGSGLSIVLSNNTRVDIDPGAELSVGSYFFVGFRTTRPTEYWRGGSTLTLGPDARLEVSDAWSGARIGPRSTINVEGEFRMGGSSYVYSDAFVTCHESVSIGEGCAIARGFDVRDSDVHRLEVDGEVSNAPAPVEIRDDVWIGTNATVNKGVTVGEGAVIASDSVVTSDVPANALVAGAPAEVIEKDVDWEL